MDVLWLPAGPIGFRAKKNSKIEDGKPIIDVVYEEGAILAVRKDGDEVLFASAESTAEDRRPLVWISLEEFSVNPVAIAVEDDFLEDDPHPVGSVVEAPPAPGGPTGPTVRRRSSEK